MLSILIPTYNYNVYPLVLELKKQADRLEINYEILVQDDNSSTKHPQNNTIDYLVNCHYYSNPINLGRGRNINLLTHKSKFEYVLILEADSFPETKQYLKNYITSILKSDSVVFGGVIYSNVKPAADKILRWKYGINRESKSLAQRLEKKYDFVFTWNLLLKKEILLKDPFPEFIREYGYEDTIFVKKLQLNRILITHIDNNLIHNNEDCNIDFIKKTENAVRTLHYLVNNHKIDYEDINLSAFYLYLKKLRIIGIVKLIYKKAKPRIIANLTSANPNLYLLDFYKLGYYCTILDSKNV